MSAFKIIENRETVDGIKHVSYPDHPEWDEPIDLSDGVTVHFVYDHVDFFGGYSWKAGDTAVLTKPEAERALFEGHASLDPVRKLRTLRSFRDPWIRDNFNEYAGEIGYNRHGETLFATEDHAKELMAAGLAVDWNEWEAAEVNPEDLYGEVAEKFLSGEFE